MKQKISIIFLVILIVACNKHDDSEYINSIKTFHNQRIENLKKPDSWLSLVGLFWLQEGENSFGTDNSNDLVFPEKLNSPKAGVFILRDSVVTVKIFKWEKVYNNDSLITFAQLKSDLTDNPTIMKSGSLSWYLIKRENKYGIRLKDSEAPLLKEFIDVEMFDIDSAYRIPAQFIEYKIPKEIVIPTAIGTFVKSKAFGKLKFTIKGKEFTLEPSIEDNEYFVVFGDLSNGEETYGAGRFLSIEKPDSSEKLYIDFNKAYNPPCAFTKYATCPLPRKENFLKIKILAGEKNYHSKYH